MNQDSVESVEPMSDLPTWREWAKETIEAHYSKPSAGSCVGERFQHRGWPPETVRAFMQAEVIKPAQGEIRRLLYG